MAPDDLVSAIVVAEWLGLHERQVRKLAEQGVIERDGRGRYRLQESVRRASVHSREAAAGRGPSSGTGPDLATERALLARAHRLAQERTNRIAVGKLFDEATIFAVVGSLLSAVRGAMLGLPSRAAPMIAGQSSTVSHTILTELVHEGLSAIADADVVVDAVRAQGGNPGLEVGC